jgi:hypothetical protein
MSTWTNDNFYANLTTKLIPTNLSIDSPSLSGSGQNTKKTQRMAKKKRKTRQEKIILQLKRELAKQQSKTGSSKPPKETRQGAISLQPKAKPSRHNIKNKSETSILSYSPKLIKKDLLKSVILATVIFSLEIVLYLKLR